MTEEGSAARAMMTPDQLQELVDLGHEQYSVEFKGPGPRTEVSMLARVLQAMMAMANHRDGGTVVVGVEEVESRLEVKGLSQSDAKSWNRDDLGNSVAVYVEPPIDFAIERVVLGEKALVVIRVAEFLDVPVVCKKQLSSGGKVLLPEGACFVRPRRKPESVRVATYVDMRDLIDLATQKGVRRFLQVQLAAGLPHAAPVPSDDERFRAQAEGLR